MYFNFKKSILKLKNPRAPRRTGQAPLAPLVRACPDGNREGVA